jgi:hypothetical protein
MLTLSLSVISLLLKSAKGFLCLQLMVMPEIDGQLWRVVMSAYSGGQRQRQCVSGAFNGYSLEEEIRFLMGIGNTGQPDKE